MTERIVAVDRALDVLLALYHHNGEMGVSELARDLDLHKSTIHRSLASLEYKGFVQKNPENGKYWLGMKIYAMGLLVGEKFSLADVVRPYAKALFEAFGEVVNVSVLDRDPQEGYKSVIILKESSSSRVLSVNPGVGSSSDLHVSSIGKCLLAFSKEIDLMAYAEQPMKRYTENTIVSWEQMMTELKAIRKQGYAIDNEEQEIGLYCIGAPILDKRGNAIAAISISGPTVRMKRDDLDEKIRKVVEISRRITQEAL